MKRLLLAPLLLTFLFGFRNKPDIINLVCNLDEISYDNKNYIYNQFMKRDYKITVNTKTEEANWYSVWLTDSPPQEFENVVITSKLIKVKRKSSGINDRKEPYFLSDYSYTINRINGEIINKIVTRYFDKNYKPTNKKELWIRGECIISDDVETLF
tara:strand:+ start:138 stop:605 length:468 start_codon:yes stop_codon:yes gene_type:complete